MNNTLVDNSTNQLSMLQTLKECLAYNDVKIVRIATGYWDIPGLALLADDIRNFLEKDGTKLLLLIGKDPYVYASQVKNPKYKDKSYPADFIRTDLCELEPKEEFENAVRLLLDYCKEDEESKIQIRIYRKNAEDETQFLHSKCYVFTGQNNAVGIVGSSNFTEKGLNGNAELNYVETNWLQVTSKDTSNPRQKSHVVWFEEKWNISEPWNKEFLEQVLKSSKIVKAVIAKKEEESAAEEFTPYELYIKLLQLQFGDIVDMGLGQQIESYLPSSIHKLDYQIEAVKRCLGIMHEHGGFMLADVVGLGKTIVGTLIIKHFLSTPEDDGRERKVLIITPPAIRSAWEKTVALIDKESDEKIAPFIDFITTGRIGKLVDVDDDYDDDDVEGDSGEFEEDLQNKNYGLIIIDESHKFRNSETIMYQMLDELILRIGSEMGEYPYIGLLTATPQNNRPNDLKNQIYLFERNHTDSTLKKAESGNIERFFAQVSREYDALIKNKSEISQEERDGRLEKLSKRIRDCVLNDILERRTRTDVKKFYKDDVEAQGLRFPDVIGPNILAYVMDRQLAQLFSDTTTIIAPNKDDKLQTDNWLRYYRYRAIEYFVDENVARKYAGRGNRNPDALADQLAKIMQILLVKRLESSFTAFKESLLNLRTYTENMINMWNNDTIFICPQIDVNKEFDIEKKTLKRGHDVTFEECIEDIRKKIEKLNKNGRNEKGQNAEYQRKDFKEEYIELLKKDLRLISKLYDRWANNSQDPKFDTFKENLNSELFNPVKNTSGKLVIFSEAISTVETLARAVEAKNHRPLVITAANRDELEHTIEENFDANYEGDWKDDYDVIITTEVLAEGVNLHRANVILNYDTPWNSTRLMQRIGRVNRIGSKEPYIYVYNFLPSAQGDSQIKLVRKAHIKLQSFHTLFGEDNKIYTEEEDVYHYDIQKAVDGEESPMQKYVYELKQYKEAHTDRYAQIEQADDDWQMAQAKSGTAYYIIKAPRSARLAIGVGPAEDGTLKGQVLSMLDMLEEMKVPENTQRVPLPDNWKELSDKAILTYNQHFVKINRTRVGDKATKAKGVISRLFRNKVLSAKSKEILNRARMLVDKGSIGIIKKLLAIDSILAEQDLFSLKQNEIDDILEREIGKLVANVEHNQGEPSILLGTLK